MKVILLFLPFFLLFSPLSSAKTFFFKGKSGDTTETYKVKKIRFHGNNRLSDSLLEFIIQSKIRFKTSPQEIDEDIHRLERTALFESVSVKSAIKNNRYWLDFQIVEKKIIPPYILQSVKVIGNKKTRENVIRREIKLLPEQPINWTTLEAGLVELEKFRIFKKVDFSLDIIEANEEKVVVELIVEVQEGLTQVGFAWPTYSSDNPDLGGWGPLGGYVNINFMGTGAWIGMGGIWAKNRAIIGGMLIPRFRGTKETLSFGIGYGEREQETFTKDFEKTGGEFQINVTGGALYWDVPLDNNLKMQHFFSVLHTEFKQIQGKLPSENAWGPLYSVAIAYDSRDDELETTTGLYPGLRLDLGYYIGEKGDREFYVRYNPTFRYYFRFGKRHGLAFQLRGGVSNPGIPYLGKYQLGGSNDLRGFPEWSIVGNNYILSNLEYRFPIFSYRSNYGISGVLFVDTGQAWDHGSAEDPFNELHLSKGAGLRFLAGPMILRLDYGFSENTNGVYFYFNHLF